jgi:radical SAM protein with 4Fe4S-binding SPASM domain
MSVNNKDTFLQHRIEQEEKHFAIGDPKDPMASILTVEVNTTELCNRTCVFCPRHDPKVYPNRNLHMTVKGATAIADQLGKIGYRGKISLSGFGENLLNPEFKRIVSTFKQRLPRATVKCNTNGDRLTKEVVEDLFIRHLDFLYINLYDGPEQIEHFEPMLVNVDRDKVKYRAHYSEEDYGLFINNRSGTIDWLNIDEEDITKLQGKKCHYPFYKMFVDWNGDVLFCSNDWGKEHVVGNLLQQDLRDVWLGKEMRKIRNRLAKGDRTNSPCDKCSVNGTLFGEKSFNIIQDYESSNNR